MIHLCVFSQYKWSAEDQTGITLSLNTVSTSTGRHSSNLVVRSGVLQPGQSYTFTLNVSQPGRGQWGSASLTIVPNNPPHGGLCDLSPESDIHLLETVVSYNCSGNTEVLVEVLLNPISINIFVTFNGEKSAVILQACFFYKSKVNASSTIRFCSANICLLFAGWQDDESRASQLIYTFQVAPCQPVGTLLTLYRWIQTSAYSN